MWNLATNQSQVVAKHDAPVRHLHYLKDMNNMLVTGSWDKTIRYWDLRQSNPVHTQQLPERIYAMDVRHPLLVVGLANRRIQVGTAPSSQHDIKHLSTAFWGEVGTGAALALLVLSSAWASSVKPSVPVHVCQR